MASETVFAAAGIIIILGFLSEWIFSKTNIPDVIWLILIGILIGPVMNLVQDNGLGGVASIFTSFALLFILFEGGLHIRIKDLMRSMYGATAITTVNFILTVAVVTLIAIYFGFNLPNAILLGTILGGTSSAVVVPIVKRLPMGKNNSLVLILESAFSDVLVIVASLTVLQIITLNAINLSGALNALFGSFAIAIFIGGIVGFLWILLLERFSVLAKSYMSTIGILLIIFGVTEFAKSSGAIAGLTFGIVVGNSRKILSLAEGEEVDTLTASAKQFFSQISFFVKTFFFVYMGILTSLTEFKPIMLGLLITAAVFLLRPLPVKLAYRPQDDGKDRQVMEVMVPKGLAAAVVAQIPLQAGIPGAEQLLTPVFATIFFTIALTTIMIFAVEHDRYAGTSEMLKRLFIRQRQSKYAIKVHRSPNAQALSAKPAKRRARGIVKRKAAKKMAATAQTGSPKATRKI